MASRRHQNRRQDILKPRLGSSYLLRLEFRSNEENLSRLVHKDVLDSKLIPIWGW